MNFKAASTEQKRQAPWAWYAAAVLLFCADRLLKLAALAGIQTGARGAAEFTLFMNTGIAFSIPVADALFWPAAVTALVALIWMSVRTFRAAPVTAAIVFFILAGAASNLLDRLAHDATVDYLLFFGRSAVNLADGMILGGLVLLATRRDAAGDAPSED